MPPAGHGGIFGQKGKKKCSIGKIIKKPNMARNMGIFEIKKLHETFIWVI